MQKLVFAFIVALVATTAQARSGYKADFNTKYGTSGTALDSCDTCHGSSTSNFNVYGQALVTAGKITLGTQVSDAVIISALTAIEPLDSDKDGFTNLAEIQARTLPYDASSKPTTAPPPTIPSCPDADVDGYVVLVDSCAVPAGKRVGDCNDNNAAVNPGATELCTNGIDDNCNGLTDTADSVCPAPTVDYDITGLSVTGTIALRKVATVSVDVSAVSGTGTATLNVTATTTTARGRTKAAQIASGVVVGATGTYSFAWKPSASGTWTIIADVVDTTANEATGDSATTTVVVP